MFVGLYILSSNLADLDLAIPFSAVEKTSAVVGGINLSFYPIITCIFSKFDNNITSKIKAVALCPT